MEHEPHTPIEPLGYIFNQDIRQVNILNQVKSYCQIPETQEDPVTWNYIWQVLRRLSLVTCWAVSYDDLFITQVRTQKFRLKQVNKCCRKCCRCDEDIVKIPLEYEPLPVYGYISGKIEVFINGHKISQGIDVDYLYEHTDWEAGILYINREDFPNILMYRANCCCLCNRGLVITLKYNAGYDNIPAGLLPIICKLIDTVDTDTSDVCASATSQVSGKLKRKKVANVEYEWSDKDDSVYTVNKLTSELNALGVLGEVMAFSRCSVAEEEGDTGSVV